MTTVQAEKIARRKLSLLQLAQELGNVSKACRIVGYSRQQFYEIRRNLQVHGADGLLDQLPGARAPHPNRVPAPVEEAILAHALEHPTHGAQRVADELMLSATLHQWPAEFALTSGLALGCVQSERVRGHPGAFVSTIPLSTMDLSAMGSHQGRIPLTAAGSLVLSSSSARRVR